MRTTLNINDEMIEFVIRETGARTKTEAVHKALEDYIYRKKIEKLIALKGKIKFGVEARTLRKGWTRKFHGSR